MRSLLSNVWVGVALMIIGAVFLNALKFRSDRWWMWCAGILTAAFGVTGFVVYLRSVLPWYRIHHGKGRVMK